MNRLRQLSATLAVALSVSLAAPAQAQVVDFDAASCGSGTQLASGYAGFTWGASAYCVTGSSYPNSGYITADPTGNVLLPWFQVPFNMVSANPFTLNSVRLAPAWNDNLQFTLVGLLGGVQQYSSTQTLTGPFTVQTLVYNWTNIDELQFSATGGTRNSSVLGGGTHFAIDQISYNQNVVPEPATVALVAAGLAGLFAARRRRSA